MKINFDDPNPGIFFKWPGAETDADGGIYIRACNIETLTDIEKSTVTKKKKFRGSAPYDDVFVDEKRKEEMIWDYCITGWENLQNEK